MRQLLAIPCLSLFWGLGTAEAQELKPRRATVGYFGESVTNPGVALGYEAAMYYRRPHELFIGAHLGGYNVAAPPSYGVFLYLEGGYRLTTGVGFFVEARVALGYINTTGSSTVTGTDGSVQPGPNISTNYLTPVAMGGIGWDFLKRTRVPISLFVDAGGMGRYNQAEPFTGSVILTTGLAYQLVRTRPRLPEPVVPPVPMSVAPSGEAEQAPGPLAPAAPPEPIAPNGPIAPGPAEPAPPAEPPQLPPPPNYPGGP